MAAIMPNWFSIATIIIYRKTLRIKKKNILVTEIKNQPENHTGAGKEIYN